MSPGRRLLGRGSQGGLHIATDAATPPGEVEASGLSLAGRPEGGLRVALEKLVLRNLRLQAAGVSIDVAQLTLNDATLTLAPSREAGAGLELLELAAGEISVQGLRLEASGAATCAPPPAGPWRLDAIGGMEGRVHAFVTDAAWMVDAGISFPLKQGRLDFNQVVVEHVGPNSAMGISPAGLYVDARTIGRTFLYLFTGSPIPGLSFERQGAQRQVTDRGHVDLQALLQGLLDAAPSATVPGRMADRHVEASLDRTRLDGDLRLGDGAIGTERHRLELDGRAQGRNRIQLSAVVLSHKLLLRLPELSASRASFELFGLQGTIGRVSADLEVEASELRLDAQGPACGASLRVEAGNLRVSQVVLGRAGPEPAEEP